MKEQAKKAGRPKAEPTKPAMIRLTKDENDSYLEMGGARYVKRMIKEYQERKAGKKVVL